MYALERFKNGERVVLNPMTEEASKKIMEWCEDNNLIWQNGDKATKNNYWKYRGKDLCYLNAGRLVYGSVSSYGSFYEVLPISLEDISKELAPVYEND